MSFCEKIVYFHVSYIIEAYIQRTHSHSFYLLFKDNGLDDFLSVSYDELIPSINPYITETF